MWTSAHPSCERVTLPLFMYCSSSAICSNGYCSFPLPHPTSPTTDTVCHMLLHSSPQASIHAHRSHDGEHHERGQACCCLKPVTRPEIQVQDGRTSQVHEEGDDNEIGDEALFIALALSTGQFQLFKFLAKYKIRGTYHEAHSGGRQKHFRVQENGSIPGTLHLVGRFWSSFFEDD